MITETGTVDWDSPDGFELVLNDGATITNQGVFTVTSYTEINGATEATKNLAASTGSAAFINEGLLVIDADNPLFGEADAVVFNLDFDNVGGTIGIGLRR